MKSLFDIAPADLGSVNVEKSVEIFRDLLWCHARKNGVPITKIHISSRVAVSDGGVDAKIDDEVKDVTSELLLRPGTCYQIKTGTSFKPWQENQLRKELFGSSTAEVSINNLGDEVKRCLEQGNKYIIVCYGIDPTAKETNTAITTLKKYFKQCGFEAPQVEVWGQTHLAGLISEFPSIVLKILGKSEYQFQTLSSWARNDDMTPSLKLGDAQEKWIGDIREALRTTNDHLRIIGEPGIGKSRLVLEALSTDDLAPNVIYIQHAEDLQKSQLFNELIRSDLEYHVILVVDECPDKERASIWNLLKAYRSKCQLITIDHGPERSLDEAMRVLNCPLLEEEQIAEIINTYIEAKEEARRWASWCSGSPRVAHAVGQNLQKNPDDIFRPPATVPIWERFVAGYEDASSELNQQRLAVLRHVALFQQFGFEPPVSDEARFIADMVNKIDTTITWGKFQSFVEQLRERRILQGSTTLFLVPKALHIYLWLDYWKHYGRGFNIKEFIGTLPAGLLKWFTRMFIYAHANPLAQQVVRDILGPSGPYDDNAFAISELGTSFLSVLAEADPEATLRSIERTYGCWTKESLREWETGRQSVVWALEKIAVWPETFQGAARILLKMGTTETSNYSNNASGTFSGLFSLVPGLASTEVAPSRRLPVLEETLKSEDDDERRLGLKACETALSTHGGFRIIGPEYQGLRPTAKLWMPKTYGELFDAYRAVWHLLFEVSHNWPEEERRLANNVLISAAHNLVPIEPLAPEIMTTIEGLLEDPATEMRSVVKFIVDTRRFRLAKLQEETLKRINQLDAKIAGSTLEKQIERYVLNSTWSEERDEDISEEQSIERRVIELAERANSEYADFLPLIEKLTRTEGHKLYEFAFEIGKRDNERKCLKSILDAQLAAGTEGQPQFIGGYLRALREASEEEWERLIIELLFDERFGKIIGQLIWLNGVNNNVLRRMLQAYEKDILDTKDFAALKFSQYTNLLDQELIEELLTAFLARNNEEASFISLEIADAFYCDREVDRKMPRELIYLLLTKPDFFTDHFDTMQGYHWGILTKKYLETYPERELELFKLIMTRLENWRIMVLKSNSTLHSIAELIAKRKPRETWEIVKDLLSDLSIDLAHGVLRWLEEERGFGEEESGIRPLTYFPADLILAWIDEDPDTRAPAIASAAPRTLDSSGDGWITRELLHRYWHIEGVMSTLFASFFTGGWSGPASVHYRKKRDRARAWLSGETSQYVIEWLNEYIDKLTSQIKSEEIREEREF